MAESSPPLKEQDPVEDPSRRAALTALLGAAVGALGTGGTGLLLFGRRQQQDAETVARLTAALAATEQQLAAARGELDTTLDQLGEQWQINAELLETLNAQNAQSLETQRHQAFQAIMDFEQANAASPISLDLVAEHAELISHLLQVTYPSSLALHQIHTTIRLVPPDHLSSGSLARTDRHSNGKAEILISDQFLPPKANLDRLTQLRLLLEQQMVYAATPFPYSELLSDGSTLYHHGFQRVTVDTTGSKTGMVGHKTILWGNVDATAAALLALTLDPEIPLDATDPYVISVFGEPTAQRIGALTTLLKAAEINPASIANLYFFSQPLAFAASVDILFRRQSDQIPEGFTAQMLTLIDEDQLTLFRQRMNSLPFSQPGQEVNA